MIELLELVTTVVIGLYAGSLLTEGCILVPYWRKMPSSEFLRLHGTMGPSLYKFFAPLTTAAVMLSCLTVLVSFVTKADFNIFRLGAAALCLGALAIFFFYFKSANEGFTNHSQSETDLPKELKRWSNWHWIRTAMIILAFILSVLA